MFERATTTLYKVGLLFYPLMAQPFYNPDI